MNAKIFVLGSIMCIGFITSSFAENCDVTDGADNPIEEVQWSKGGILCMYETTNVPAGMNYQKPLSATNSWHALGLHIMRCTPDDTGVNCPFVRADDAKQRW